MQREALCKNQLLQLIEMQMLQPRMNFQHFSSDQSKGEFLASEKYLEVEESLEFLSLKSKLFYNQIN